LVDVTDGRWAAWRVDRRADMTAVCSAILRAAKRAALKEMSLAVK
jgi:hypothetical protein